MAQQRKAAGNGATLGFEETLWAAADPSSDYYLQEPRARYRVLENRND
jgi:hypothetical protein